MKRIVAICLCVCFLTVSFRAFALPMDGTTESGQTGTTLTEKGFQLVTDRKSRSLYVNIDTAEVCICDNVTGRVWSTNPFLTSESNLTEVARRQLESQLRVTYMDEMRNIILVNSYDACVRGKSFAIRTVKDNGVTVGVKITYDFNDEAQRFRVPLVIKLTDTGFSAQIPVGEIEEYGSSMVSSVDILPSFGAASGNEDGYLFVPDGSGALIFFSDRYKNAENYDEPVYGFDCGTALGLSPVTVPEGIRMPVFGMKTNHHGFIAMITSGEALSRIKAFSSQDRYGFSSVCGSYTVREVDDTGISDGGSLQRVVTMADSTVSSTDYCAEYTFLSGNDANYSGMAQVYRAYLTEKYKLKRVKCTDASAPFLELFGKTYRRASFLGIPYQRTVRATTFEQAAEIYEDLSKNGVLGVQLGLYGFSAGGYHKNVKREKFDSALGGEKDFSRLLDTVKDGGVYVAYDMIRDYSAVTPFFKKNIYIRSMNGLIVTRNGSVLSSGAVDGARRWLLKNGDAVLDSAETLMKSLKNPKRCGILYSDMGYEIYSDFSEENPKDRQQLLDDYSSVLKKTRSTVAAVASDGANVYMLSGSNLLCEVPLAASEKAIISQSVPFYAMVLHGVAELSSKPFNVVSDPGFAEAYCAQFGLRPTYRLTACNGELIRGTNLEFLYNSDYEGWKKTIKQQALKIMSIQKDLSDQTIKSHSFDGSLSVTEYENGTVIVYNGSAELPVEWQGKMVAPLDVVRFDD